MTQARQDSAPGRSQLHTYVGYSSIFVGIFPFLLGPLVQLLDVADFPAEAFEIRSRGSATALTIFLLVLQALGLSSIGISFIFRLDLPSEGLDEQFIVDLQTWYRRFGWATVNNVGFALAQGVLAWIASQQANINQSE